MVRSSKIINNDDDDKGNYCDDNCQYRNDDHDDVKCQSLPAMLMNYLIAVLQRKELFENKKAWFVGMYCRGVTSFKFSDWSKCISRTD